MEQFASSLFSSHSVPPPGRSSVPQKSGAFSGGTPSSQGNSSLAVIYCRVSSERQVKEGGGLQSQEQRCRSYALSRGYDVVGVFGDDGVSGALFDRRGIESMLAFLRSKNQSVVVIVDDISRIARDVKTHLELRAVIAGAGGVLESPSMRFEDSAAGEFIELVLAASAQFGRKGNREQVLNRQKARLQLGYWTFPAPPGYHYEKSSLHKKHLAPTKQARDILGPALEAFAQGRILGQRALALHLRDAGFYESKVTVSVLEKRVARILEALPLYAGFVEYPLWGVERVVGHHDPIIKPVTLAQLEARLVSPMPSSAPRSDAHPDFVLRGFIRCPECGRPLTGCRAKRIYPRYFCYAQGKCSRYGRSISARLLEPAFEGLLHSVAPREEVVEGVRVLSTAQWRKRCKHWDSERRQLEHALREKEGEVAALISRLAKISDEDVATEIEKSVLLLKKEHVQGVARLAEYQQDPPDYEGAFEAVSTLLLYPHLLWKNGSYKQKRTVHRLVFTVPPAFDRNEGFSTYELSLPYLISGLFAESNSRMVEVTSETWQNFAQSILELQVGVEMLDDDKS